MLSVVQLNAWNYQQDIGGVTYSDRYRRFFEALLNHGSCDIICVQEVIDPVCFEKIARDFGFDFFAWSDGKALSSQGLDNFVGVISKYPIIDHEIVEFSAGKCR